MTETKHTPGPWYIVRSTSPKRQLSVFDATSCVAAVSVASYEEYPHQTANARLIAAAPDLLEALHSIENDDGRIPAAIWELRNSAIAKALGLPR